MATEMIVDKLHMFSGKIFEKMIVRKLIEDNPLNLKFTKIGNYWDRKGKVEIDIIVLNELDKKVYFFEVKLDKKKVNQKIMNKLIENSLTIREFEKYDKFYYIAYPDKDEINFHQVEV